MKLLNRVLTTTAVLLTLGSSAFAQSYDAHPNQFDTFRKLNGAEASSGEDLATGRSAFSGNALSSFPPSPDAATIEPVAPFSNEK